MKNASNLEKLNLAAFQAFQAKEYTKALDIYKKILADAPSDLTTIFNMAVTSQELGKLKEAKKYYLKHLEIQENIKVLNNLLVIAITEHDSAKAEEYYRKIHLIDPLYASAFINLLHYFFHEEDFDTIEKLVVSYPDLVRDNEVRAVLSGRYSDYGSRYFQQKDTPAAIDFFQKALEWAPEDQIAVLNQNLATCMIRIKDVARLENHAKIAYEKNPESPQNIFNLGIYYFLSTDYEKAQIYIKKGLEQEPQNPIYWHSLANVLYEVRKLDDALSSINKALEIEPENLHFRILSAQILCMKNRFDEAMGILQEVLSQNPDHQMAVLVMGTIYIAWLNMEEAEKCFLKVLSVDPYDKDGLVNMSQVCYHQGKYQEAIPWLEKALTYHPDYYLAHQNLAVVLLGLFEFKRGWEEYRYRKIDAEQRDTVLRRDYKELPSNLRGKRILIRSEQGFGDELFFLRFLPLLKSRGAWITYFPGAKLYDVLSTCPYIDSFIKEGESIANIDYDIYVAQLPELLGMDSLEKIPSPLPLKIAAQAHESISGRFNTHAGPFIGITWRAGIQKFNFLSKEIPLEQIIETLKGIDATIVVLQRNPLPEEIESLQKVFGDRLIDASGYNDDLEKMIAVLAVLNSYVAISNTNIHLAAGIGKKCHILLPFPPEWRWGYEPNEFSPWFPGFKIYRQESLQGSWTKALQGLRKDIEEELALQKQMEHYRAIVEEAIKKIDELIGYRMYEEAEQICHKILGMDEHNIQVLALLSKILLLMERYDQLMQVNEKLIQSAAICGA